MLGCLPQLSSLPETSEQDLGFTEKVQLLFGTLKPLGPCLLKLTRLTDFCILGEARLECRL